MPNKLKNKSFAVLGLGRFGMSIVETLSKYDVNILACDKNEIQTHEAARFATHVVQMDISDEVALKTLGLGNFDVVILAMGEEFEASQIATMVALEQGARHIIVKARNKRQKKIFENLGIKEVILPEHEMGVKIALKLVGSNVIDIFGDLDRYTVSEMKPLDEWLGKTIHQSDIRRKYGIIILAVWRSNKLTVPITTDWVISQDDILITMSEHNE